MNGTWPIAYKIDDSHLIVESTCLNPKTGQILWTSPDFTCDTMSIVLKKKCST
jgi:hypothetical protein